MKLSSLRLKGITRGLIRAVKEMDKEVVEAESIHFKFILFNLNIYLFRSQSHFPAAAFGSLTRSNPHVYVVVSSDSKAATSLDLTQPDLDNSGGDANGNDNGGGGGGGGGGEGGGDNSKGKEGSDGDKRKMPLLMSQKFILAYAALAGVCERKKNGVKAIIGKENSVREGVENTNKSQNGHLSEGIGQEDPNNHEGECRYEGVGYKELFGNCGVVVT
ncbi:hypothetical protein JHK87_018710 [Glycine soja]|nr:hypothetical protein JHK87_018710 [Glycine soja]